MRVTESVKIAVIFRALRNAFCMSQNALAELGGSSRPTINRLESLQGTSARTDTVDELLRVFRERGVEIQVGDDEIQLRFTKKALLAAAEGIQSNLSSKT